MVLAFGLILVGCNRETDIVGTWAGNIQGENVTVEITRIGWSFTVPAFGFADTGTYVRDGDVGRLISDTTGSPIGMAQLLDRNSLSLILNERSIAPGTHRLSRQ